MTFKPRTLRSSQFAIITLLLFGNLIVAQHVFAATSFISITSSPYISFIDLPDTLLLNSGEIPVTDQEFLSDADGTLPTSRNLTIQDTRGCGGLNVQLQADNFTPVTTPEFKNSLRIVTSAATNQTGTTVSNVKYLTGFTGNQTITAPLNVATTNFNDPALFTGSPFDVTDNTLTAAQDLLQGNLTAPTGRDGQMNIGLSFYLAIPKYTPAGNYYTTFTYTISDDTTGSCP